MKPETEATIDVEGTPSPEGLRAFWETFARIAIEALDDEASPREHPATEEPAA